MEIFVTPLSYHIMLGSLIKLDGALHTFVVKRLLIPIDCKNVALVPAASGAILRILNIVFPEPQFFRRHSFR